MINQKLSTKTVGQRFARLAIVAVALTLPLAGCENILEVNDHAIVFCLPEVEPAVERLFAVG